MSDFDTLITRLRERVHSPQGSTDNASDYPPHLRKPPALPLSPDEMAEAEDALGFALPPLLYRLYSEVGNGRWGPGYGLEPLYQTAAQREEAGEVVTVVRRAQYFQAHKPEQTLLIQVADWGCAISSWTDAQRPNLPVVRRDPNLDNETLDQAMQIMTGREPSVNPYLFFKGWQECDSLSAWLQAWTDGADLWNLGYPSEWKEEE